MTYQIIFCRDIEDPVMAFSHKPLILKQKYESCKIKKFQYRDTITFDRRVYFLQNLSNRYFDRMANALIKFHILARTDGLLEVFDSLFAFNTWYSDKQF